MATAQVEAGDLHFTAIGNIPGASVAIQLWPNDDARGLMPLTRERGRMPLHVHVNGYFLTNYDEHSYGDIHSRLLLNDSSTM